MGRWKDCRKLDEGRMNQGRLVSTRKGDQDKVQRVKLLTSRDMVIFWSESTLRRPIENYAGVKGLITRCWNCIFSLFLYFQYHFTQKKKKNSSSLLTRGHCDLLKNTFRIILKMKSESISNEIVLLFATFFFNSVGLIKYSAFFLPVVL